MVARHKCNEPLKVAQQNCPGACSLAPPQQHFEGVLAQRVTDRKCGGVADGGGHAEKAVQRVVVPAKGPHKQR